MKAFYASFPWQFLYFLPLPQGQGSFRPTFGLARRYGSTMVVGEGSTWRRMTAPAMMGSSPEPTPEDAVRDVLGDMRAAPRIPTD